MPTRLACISIDLDGLGHYEALHGLPRKSSPDAVAKVAPPRLAELLDERAAKGTFFAIGNEGRLMAFHRAGVRRSQPRPGHHRAQRVDVIADRPPPHKGSLDRRGPAPHERVVHRIAWFGQARDEVPVALAFELYQRLALRVRDVGIGHDVAGRDAVGGVVGYDRRQCRAQRARREGRGEVLCAQDGAEVSRGSAPGGGSGSHRAGRT